MAGWTAAAQALLGAGGAMFAGAGSQKAAGVASNIVAGGYQDARDQFRQSMDTGNAYLQDASGKAIDWATQAANFAGGTAVDQARASSADVSGRADTANTMLDPYRQAGSTAVTQIGDLANQQFKFGQDDPSYQWRLQQGQQALQRSAAARGGVLGGGAAKALASYGQNMASTEYQKAFDRFQANRTNQLKALGGLAELGYGAAGQSGQNLLKAGEYGGNLMQQGTEYAGNAGMWGAQYGGNMLANTATQLAANQRWGGQNMANMTLGRSGALASGVLGQQAGKNQMWNAFSQGAMGAMGAPWGTLGGGGGGGAGNFGAGGYGGYGSGSWNWGAGNYGGSIPGVSDYTPPPIGGGGIPAGGFGIEW